MFAESGYFDLYCVRVFVYDSKVQKYFPFWFFVYECIQNAHKATYLPFAFYEEILLLCCNDIIDYSRDDVSEVVKINSAMVLIVAPLIAVPFKRLLLFRVQNIWT